MSTPTPSNDGQYVSYTGLQYYHGKLTDNLANTYIPLSGGTAVGRLNSNGGTMLGTLIVESNTGDYCEGVRINRSTSGWATLMLGCTQNSTAGVASGWCMHRDTGGRFVLSGINSTYSTALFYGTYNSSTSQHTLTIPHNLITGTIYVTSGAVELTSPATNSGHGGYLDFHYNKSSSDYTSRIIETASGTLNVNGVTFNNSKINGYTLAGACAKGVETTISQTDDNVPTSKAVYDHVSSVTSDVIDILGGMIPTYSNMGAASASAAGTAGLVPAPAKGAQGKYLRGDGTWQTPTGTLNTCGAGNNANKLFLVGRTAQSTGTSYSNSYVYMSGGFLTCAGARLTPTYEEDDYATVNLIIQQPNSDTNNTYGLIVGELDGTVLNTYRLGGRYTPSDDSGAVMINARHGVKGSNPVWGREFTVTPWRPSFEGQEIHNGMCYTNSDGYSGFIKFRYANSSDDGNTEAGMTKHIMLAWAWTEISADSQGDIYWPVKWFNEDHYLCWANVYNTGGGYNNYGCGPVWCSARYKDHATFKNDTWGGPVYAFAIGIAYD